jgi:hypothetical protein
LVAEGTKNEAISAASALKIYKGDIQRWERVQRTLEKRGDDDLVRRL